MANRNLGTRDIIKLCAVVCIVIGAFLVGALTNGHNSKPAEVEAGGPVEHVLDKRSVRAATSDEGRRGNDQDVRTRTPKADGAVYIRWGRTVCPPEATRIYKGAIAGGHSGHTAGSTYICLTDTPVWDTFVAGGNAYAYIYGAEFKAHPTLFSSKNMQGFTDHDGACVACLSIRNSQIMIPGTKTCVPGWTKEYNGMLMSAKYTDKGGKDYICVDYEAEADREGYRKDGGADMWPVEVSCGSLPCPPYEHVKELTCVVCTR